MPTIQQNRYVLAVPDADRSAEFFVRALGFAVVARPPGWVFVSKDHCTIMLGSCPDDLPPTDLGSHSYFAYLVVDDADEYHARLVAAGVSGLGTIGNRPWDMREFALATPDGHRLMIGHRIGATQDE